MAPPPEYDKEPKAPDKSATNISCEETKTVHNLVNDQPSNSDNKSASTATNAEVENNKLVETLDDGQLRALLDEAITYKCPKDREGKSNLFKELLEEVEQDEQASEAAARGAGAGAGVRSARAPPRPSRNRRALPHSNSLQDLVAALAAEPPRRHRPAPSAAPAPVSARAIHGGSLPSGVDTSFLLGEEPMGGGYLATVRCVNPPPLNERRVSATDANAAAEVEMLTRRSKPASFPMTYTARATLEIGAPAATTTTPSNQVPYPPPRHTPPRTNTAGLTAPEPPNKRSNPTTTDPEWDFMRALNAPKQINVTEEPKISKQKAKSNKRQSRTGDSRKQKVKSGKTPKENSGVAKAKIAEPQSMRPSNKNQGLMKQSLPKTNYSQPKTSEIPNVPLARNLGPQILYTKAQGPKINKPRSFGNNQQNYYVEGYGSLPLKIHQRHDNSHHDDPNKKKLYSYRLSPTVGPPERLYSKKLYNPYRRRIRNKGYIQSEPETETLNEIVIPGDYNESSTSESNYVTANMIQDQTLTNYTDLNSTLEDDSTELNISLLEEDIDNNQLKLLSALLPKQICDRENGGGRHDEAKNETEKRGWKKLNSKKVSEELPIGDKKIIEPDIEIKSSFDGICKSEKILKSQKDETGHYPEESELMANINNWYGTLEEYAPVPVLYGEKSIDFNRNHHRANYKKANTIKYPQSEFVTPRVPKDIVCSSGIAQRFAPKDDRYKWTDLYPNSKEDTLTFPLKSSRHMKRNVQKPRRGGGSENINEGDTYQNRSHNVKDTYLYSSCGYEYDYSYTEPIDHNIYLERQKYRERVGKTVSRPDQISPRNIRSMTIGKPLPEMESTLTSVNECTTKKSSQNKHESENNGNTLSIDNQTKSDIGFINTSYNRNKVVEELENVDAAGDKIINITARSSTPISDLNDIVEAENDAKNTGEVQVETGSKESPVENDKGTVHINIVSQSDYVTLDIDKGLPTDFCSFSENKDERGGDSVEQAEITPEENKENSIEFKNICKFTSKSFEVIEEIELSDLSASRDCEELMQNEHELVDIPSLDRKNNTSFSTYLAAQRQLFQALEDNDLVDSAHERSLVSNLDNSEKVHCAKDELLECVSENVQDKVEESLCVSNGPMNSKEESSNIITTIERANGEKCIGDELSNNAYVFLTLPQNLLAHLSNIDDTIPLQIEYSNRSNKSKKKKDPAVDITKKKELIHKNALRALLFENISKSDSADKSKSKGMSTVTIKEVDSTIPFSCITTPEVVASCNTTSSSAQSAVAVDPKPLQLGSSYRAVASLTGDPPAPSAPPPPRPHGHACLCCRPAPSPASSSSPRSVVSSTFNGLPLSRPNYGSTASTTQDEFKKSLDENGNSVQGYSSPLSGSSQHKKPRRKKSSKNETVIKSHQIDGYQGNKDLNEVLRFIESNAESTRAGKLGRTKHKDDADDKSGKKRSTERRKDKESKMKRATSMEELSRTKLEDLTDKPGKKERRNDAAPKAERRSWGDDARDSFYYHEEPQDADFQTVTKKRKPRRRADEAEAGEAAGSEAASGDPPRPLLPSPRARRVSAPPSDRSNDSNDDMDSVHSLHSLHSLPADAPKAAAAAHAPVSYADIARTRHNIPDLIESCNFYAEGEVRLEGVPAAAMDVDGYPALEARGGRRVAPPPPTPAPAPLAAPPHAPPPATPTATAKHAAAHTAVRHSRKTERVECTTGVGVGAAAVPRSGSAPLGVGGAPPAPAPDVVADRRPPVILLDSARAHDMDGVTFGFDINEQLLGGPTRRPRCDLVRDAIEVTTLPPSDTNGTPSTEPESPPEPTGVDMVGPGADALLGVGVAVVVGCAALRYVAPRPPADTTHLHQIIDYVGAAWEDVVRCGGGKVRYFSE